MSSDDPIPGASEVSATPKVPEPGSVEALLAVVEGLGGPLPGQETLDGQVDEAAFYGAFNRWMQEFEVYPGAARAATADELRTHFLGWLERQNTPMAISLSEFGRRLRLCGLEKGRDHRGKDRRPYLLRGAAANYFRAWLLANPMPPGKSK